MARFEKVSRFNKIDITLPIRKTANSAGYDFEVAEDTIIPPYINAMRVLSEAAAELAQDDEANLVKDENGVPVSVRIPPMELKEVADLTKLSSIRPTLVSTGVKCYLDAGTYLELSVRSSSPLKYWLILANGIGIIDADYADNPDNEGEIFFQLINLSPVAITLRKGDIIGQGIIKSYLTTENDTAIGERVGGFGSTDQQ
jgi:dUTP pyrophosphatase